ncbi:MAG: hypothetical protein LBK66_09760 [Spirochaetaceae bacterium]|jgi:hypothetical protein|nr:hypothetical protein [Spirochaetaceae bacterium]
MKNKSFLFLIAALALTLALLGCSSDSDDGSGYPVPGPKEGYLYSSTLTGAQKIMLSFQDAPDVYLEDETDLQGGVVIIPSGKTLHVNGQTVKVDKDTVIVVASGGKLDWDGKATSVIAGTSAVVIGKTYEEGRYIDGAYDEDSNTFGINFGEIGKNKYAGSESVGWHTAAASYDDLVIGASGTTGYLLGNFNGATDFVPAGTLYVGGNLTLSANKVITSTAALTVYGKLTGGTNAAQSIITGTVSAISADINGGQIANDLTIFRDGNFGDGVTFNGALNVLRDATFGEVEFKDTAEVTKKAAFTSAKVVTGSVSVGNLAFTGSSNNLVLDENGRIIFTSGTTPTFFTGAGTLAALGGSVSFTVDANKLTVDGKGQGTFAVGNNGINLTANSIQVAAETGVYLGGQGSIASENYSIGDKAGTLSADKGFILTATGIAGVSDRPTLTYELESESTFLTVKNDKTATITNANINLNSTGSIAVFSGNLILTGGGSVTAGEIAWGGTIAGTATAAGGSLLVGSLALAAGVDDGIRSAESVAAGSVGTQSDVPGVIVSSAVFLPTKASVAQGSIGINDGTPKDGGSASIGGSILIFGRP